MQRLQENIGIWECTHYAMYNEYEDIWRPQPEAFLNLFEMTLYEDGRAILNTSGEKSTGMYTLESDTLVLNIRDNTSKYLWEGRELKLIEHPRVRITYEKTNKKIGE
ncbi:MAG: hypothetical protein U5N26_02800 [Candidatus Marinimicrobia bacterium]|nr:hypothetical protein [Candidatus Neomarinimicrobiota bacterium]